MKTKVSAKGQVVIPREARELLHLKEGTELEVEVRGSELVLHKASAGSWRSWRGRFKGLDLAGALEAEHRDEARRRT